MKHILIVDDHALVRRGLKETLEEELKDVAFGEAEGARQARELVARQPWDLVLLDIGMEDTSGMEALEEMRRLRPKLAVLMVSMYPEKEFALRALRLGAAGYLNKRSAPDELLVAVNKVLAGGRYVSPALADQLAAEIQQAGNQSPHQKLSDREFQVLRLVASGKTLKEIAEELSLSVKTVGTYHIRLMEKMGMKSDVEMTRYALKNKLVE